MFGGTAKTYAKWELLGEPYKEDKVWYVDVKSPTGIKKTVRWYKDTAHAALMPKKQDETPYYTIFGFKSETDYIYCVKEKDLTKKQRKECELSDWRNAAFFGGIWYRSEVPQDEAFNGFLCSWPQFVEEAYNYIKKKGVKKNNVWIQEKEKLAE